MSGFFKIWSLTFSISLCTFSSLSARVRLPALFSDHMVLQQSQNVVFWGWSDPNAIITISCSWENEVHQVNADNRAHWKTLVKTPTAGGPYTISISERNTIVLHHVMIGEVWLCSGQSNMEWTPTSGIDNKEQEIENSNNPLIHHIRIPKGSSDHPQENVDATWEVCSPESMPHFSAVAYFFAKELTERLKVPVGIIHSSWGGSAAEAWTPKNLIEADPEFSKWREVFPENYQWPYLPGTTYNAMIYPLAPFRIAGVLWYQGESNTSNALVYRRLFPAMIGSWREAWGYEFPFYFVQIAPFNYGRPLQGSLVQEAQLKTLEVSNNTGIVVTTDIGNVQDIHPKNKQDVGKRLALWALGKNYNQSLIYSGPLYKSMNKENNKIIVEFNHTGEGLMLKGNKPDLYKIAGENRQFVEAHVEIEGDKLVFSNENIPDPVAVRYAFTNIAEGNLYNKEGLPASPFRTDDWPIIYNNVMIKSVYDPVSQGFLVTMVGENTDLIVYNLDGTEPGLQSNKYTGPFLVKQKTQITAKAITQQLLSENTSSKEVLMNKATYRPISYITPYSTKYGGSGTYTLINGQRGNINSVNDKEWLGWEGNDMEVVLDLGENTRVKKIEVSFLQNQNAWVFLPKQVEIFVSSNGKQYTEVFNHEEPLKNDRTAYDRILSASINQNVRYVRIVARNQGVCPPWHPGAGSKSWLFADEIIVE